MSGKNAGSDGRIASKRHLVVSIAARPGSFVTSGDALSAKPEQRNVSKHSAFRVPWLAETASQG
jgi:hypothetical protein